MPRTVIITGAYGSGKTECALALALEWAAAEPVTMVDLDFVNPYFRAQDHRAALEARGIRVIAPEARVAAIDAPSLPPEAGEAMVRPRGCTIVDLGGDPAGAVVIAQFADALRAYEMWGVVNFFRPTTATPTQAEALLRDIARTVRLRLTGLIGNTHLGAQTTPEDLAWGLSQIHDTAVRLAVPVVRVGVPADVALPPLDVPALRITPYLKRPWE